MTLILSLFLAYVTYKLGYLKGYKHYILEKEAQRQFDQSFTTFLQELKTEKKKK